METIEQELARLRAENEQLKSRRNNTISFKVSDKGALSVYGMGRFPVTLYKEQWNRLLEQKDAIIDFINANSDKLSVKE
jgi:hypothetical protein